MSSGSNTIRKLYRVRCITENTNVETWSTTIPTECPNDPAHQIGHVKLVDQNQSGSPLVPVVVSATEGEGNYTSIAEAFSDGNMNVYVRNGTYVESQDIVLPDRGLLCGEAMGAVVVVLTNGASVRVDGSGGIKQTSGSISINNGSSIVTGNGTTFSSLTPGKSFVLVGNNFFQISTITSDTECQLQNVYNGASATNLPCMAQSMNTGNTISNLVITGSSTVGLFVRAARFCTINSLALSRNATNLHVTDSGDCTFRSFTAMNSLSGPGLRVCNSVDVFFSYCNLHGNTGIGVEVTDDSTHVVFDACSSSCNNGHGFLVDSGASHVIFAHGSLKQNNGIGVHSTSTAGIGIVLVSSTSHGNASDGVRLDGSGGVASACNLCDNARGAAILGANCRTCGCLVQGSSGDGVVIEGDSTICTGNTIIGNAGRGAVVSGSDSIFSSNIVSTSGGIGVDIAPTASRSSINATNCLGNTGANFVDSGVDTHVTGIFS